MARDADYLTQRELDLILRGKIPPERTRKAKANAKRLIIRTMFERWIVFYRTAQRQDIGLYLSGICKVPARFAEFFSDELTPLQRATLARMNSGDCGTTALAVGQALELLGFDVTYCDLGDHACLLIDGMYYDALKPNGESTMSAMFGYKESAIDGLGLGTADLLHNAYLPFDELGAQLVETFVRMLSLNYRYPFTIET